MITHHDHTPHHHAHSARRPTINYAQDDYDRQIKQAIRQSEREAEERYQAKRAVAAAAMADAHAHLVVAASGSKDAQAVHGAATGHQAATTGWASGGRGRGGDGGQGESIEGRGMGSPLPPLYMYVGLWGGVH